MRKVLSITGPTATGKTSLAVALSKKIPSNLISADSRQVYKGMDVVTGKDHPDDVAIKLIDIVDPDKKFSVSEWLTLAKKEIKNSWESGLLPIVVGGTGLYIKALQERIDTLGVKPDPDLRASLSKLNVKELQEKLQSLNKEKLDSMNNSDRSNPRRLIRAIEVALSPSNTNIDPVGADFLNLALKPPKNYATLIKERVLNRMENSKSIKETKELLKKYDSSLESFSSLGYSPLIKFINNKIDKDELVAEWTIQEISYFKRQMTWFNKQNYLTWVTANSPDEVLKIVNFCYSWYHEIRNGK